MSHHWTVGGPPESEETRDHEDQPEVRPWQPAVVSPPVVRTPQFMLGGRLAGVREPSFMRRILPRVIVPALEENESVSRGSEIERHGK